MKRLFLILVLIIACCALSAVNLNWSQSHGPYGNSVWACQITNAGTLLAGLGDGRIYRSADNGASWQTVYSSDATWRKMILLSDNSILAGNAHREMIKSVDDGLTWTVLTPGFPEGFDLRDIVMTQNHDLFAATGDGVYRSTDNGQSWTIVNFTNYSFSIAVDNNNNLYTATYQGVFRSADNGQNWTMISVGFNATLSVEYYNSTLYVGTENGLYKYADSTWTGPFMNDQNIQYLIKANDVLYAGCQSGVYISTNDGLDWTPANIDSNIKSDFSIKDDMIITGSLAGLFKRGTSENWKMIGTPIGVDFLNISNGRIFAGLNDGNTALAYVNSNLNEDWTMINSALHCAMYKIEERADSSVFIGLSGGVMGTAWIETYNPLSVNEWENWIQIGFPTDQMSVSAIHVSENGDVFVGGDTGAYKLTFVPSSDMPEMDMVEFGLADKIVYDFIEGLPGDLLAITNHGIYKSSNGSSEWTTYSLNSDSVFAIMENNGNYYARTNNGIYTSTNTTDWTLINNGLTVNALTKLFVTSNGTLGVICNNQLYRSTDNGQNWVLTDDTINQWEVHDIVVQNDKAILATKQGIFIAPFSVVAEDNPEIKPVLSASIYPNPFNPTTNISFNLQKNTNVKLDIYNIKGQKVKSLVNSPLNQGNHTLVWNGTDDNGRKTGSGVYFCKISADKQSVCKKMLLMK